MGNQELTLVRVGEAVHLDGKAPPIILITQDLLDHHDPRWMQVNGDDVVFSLANGTWHYRLTGYAAAGATRSALKVSGACCGMHGTNCESPSELCCPGCTEASHVGLTPHADGTVCVCDQAGGVTNA